MKRLIINADDFGFTRDVNAGIVHAHLHGVLTSTTLMANGDAFHDAVRLAGQLPTLDIGAHLVLVQGNSLISGKPFPERPRHLLVALARQQLNVYAEMRAQIQKIVDVGIRITHLDSHKHTHIVPQVFRAVVRLAKEYNIPYVRLPIDHTLPVPAFIRAYYWRLATAAGVRVTDHFLGFRLTGKLTEASLLHALRNLLEGTTEFMCHPGYLDTELAHAATRLKQSRVLELQALTSPRVKQLLTESGVRLGPFVAVTRP